jgi:cell shape-determining protein MreC
MRRPYYHKRNTGVYWWAGAIGVALLIIIFRLVAPGAFVALTAPLSHTGVSTTASLGNVFASFTSNASLAQENTELRAENAALKNQNQALTVRTQDLTKLLGDSTAMESGYTAGVIARPPESPYDTLIIGDGSSEGIKEKAEVFAQGGVPIGTIKHAYGHSAQVSLFSSPGRTTAGWVGADREALTLIGQGSGTFIAKLPKGAAVAVGDGIYIPGPGALPIGTIVKIDTDPSSPTEIIRIQPSVNLFSVTWVEVAKNPLGS